MNDTKNVSNFREIISGKSIKRTPYCIDETKKYVKVFRNVYTFMEVNS